MSYNSIANLDPDAFTYTPTGLSGSNRISRFWILGLQEVWLGALAFGTTLCGITEIHNLESKIL